jgi:hypothetical protein
MSLIDETKKLLKSTEAAAEQRRTESIAEYRQIVGRAKNPKKTDPETLLKLMSELGITQGEVEQDAAALAEIGPAERELGEAQKSLGEWHEKAAAASKAKDDADVAERQSRVDIRIATANIQSLTTLAGQAKERLRRIKSNDRLFDQPEPAVPEPATAPNLIGEAV